MVSTRILNVIYALKEADRRDQVFRPIIETEDLAWHFEISEFDKLGLLLNHIEIKAHNPASLLLEGQFEQVQSKIRSLQDFQLVEYDPTNATMLLRSRVPKKLDDVIRYYEIVLKGGNQLRFARYEFDPAIGRRRVIPANLARETFEELLVDLETIFSAPTSRQQAA
jgi:hypothetical protein